VQQLPLSSKLKDDLSTKYAEIDNDNSGRIDLTEFLYFFLQYKPFKKELKKKFWLKEPLPSVCLPGWLQTVQLCVHNVVNFPEYSICAKVIFCIDLSITLIPCTTLLLEAVSPRHLEKFLFWDEEFFL